MCDKRRVYYLSHREQRIAETKAWKHRNPEAAAEYMRDYRERLRLTVVNGYGGKCTCCGESEPAFLTLEHLNGDGKAHRERRSGSLGTYRDVIRLGFPKEYTVLCMNCNYAKGQLGICPHQIK